MDLWLVSVFCGRISSIKPLSLMFGRQNLTLYFTYHHFDRYFVLMLATFNDLKSFDAPRKT